MAEKETTCKPCKQETFCPNKDYLDMCPKHCGIALEACRKYAVEESKIYNKISKSRIEWFKELDK